MIIDYNSIGTLRESRVVAKLQGQLFDEYAEAVEIKSFGYRLWQVNVIDGWDFVRDWQDPVS